MHWRNRGGRSTKIHAVVDGLGNPLSVFLTSGDIYDSTATETALGNVDISGSNVLADKAYGTVKFRKYITVHGAEYCIPPKVNAVTSRKLTGVCTRKEHSLRTFPLKSRSFSGLPCVLTSLLWITLPLFISLALVCFWNNRYPLYSFWDFRNTL